MASAREVAQQLAAKFLEHGNYAAANPMNAAALRLVMPAAAPDAAISEFIEEAGFEGLAVQSVGYEEGADEPKVHIYVTKGSWKGLKSLPEDEDGVTIQVNKMGKL